MKKHTPQGIQVVMTALVVLLGVALLTLPAQAMDSSTTPGDGSDYYVGMNNRTGGGSGGAPSPVPEPGGEADPDWWQTDTWAGQPVGAAPAPMPQEPRALAIRPISVTTVGPFGAIVTWFLTWAVRSLGSGR